MNLNALSANVRAARVNVGAKVIDGVIARALDENGMFILWNINRNDSVIAWIFDFKTL